MASLLLRFWDPQSGAVRLDGADLRGLKLDSLRERVALVTQDTYLFNDTLEGNILLARPRPAARNSSGRWNRPRWRFRQALPDGLRTRVGERGMQLSGGQRQRISIARAFLKNAPVLILDEATSHLDTLSEMRVRGALDTLMRHRTTLVIAHRLSTIRDADLIPGAGPGRAGRGRRTNNCCAGRGCTRGWPGARADRRSVAQRLCRPSVLTDLGVREPHPLAAEARVQVELVAGVRRQRVRRHEATLPRRDHIHRAHRPPSNTVMLFSVPRFCATG